MKLVRAILSFAFFTSLFILTSNLMAGECDILPEHQGLECQGVFVAKNAKALTSYAKTLKIKNGKAKNLTIDFDIDQESLTIATPCRIRVRPEHTIKLTGNLCLRANQELTFLNNSTIEVKDLSLYSNNRIAIRDNASIKAENIKLISDGTNLNSNVHIRHHSEVTAKSLELEAYGKATLGHTSTYNVEDYISLKTSDYEFSSIWKDTTITTKRLEIISSLRARIAAGVRIDAEEVKIEGNECNVSKKAIINSTIKNGSCFAGGHPTARLKADVVTGVAPLTVNFDASKSKDDQGIVEYAFQFTNTDFLTQATPTASFTFTTPGTYMVRVIVKDADGLQARTTRKIVVEAPFENQPPVPTFDCWYDYGTRNYGCWAEATDPDGFPAFGHYKVSNGTSTKEFNDWSFDDHFDDAGVYTVTFTVTDNLGLSSSAEKTLYVDTNIPPTADFGCDVNQRHINCYSQAEDADGFVSNPIWFINGEEYGRDWSFEYDAPENGNYTVTFRISDGIGDESEQSKEFNLSVNIPPVANMNCWQSPDNNAFGCNDESSDEDGYVAQGFFSVNGTPIKEIGGNIEYDSASEYQWWFNYYDLMPGTYNVSLTVLDNTGSASTIDREVTLGNQGSGNINAVLNCQQNSDWTISCDASGSSSTDGAIVDYQWEYSDGGSDSGVSILHYFVEGGSGYARLTVYDELNQSSSAEYYFDFSTLVYPVINCEVQNAGTVYCNSYASSTAQGVIANTIWNMGDGTELNGLEISHQYSEMGTYTIKADVYNSHGFSGHIEQIIQVDTLYVGDIRMQCDQSGLSVECQSVIDNSTIDLSLWSYAWYVNGESVGNTTDLVKTFEKVGAKNVKVVATAPNGMSISSEQEIVITPEAYPIVEIDNNNFEGAYPYVFQASVKELELPNGAIARYQWTMRDETFDTSTVEYEFNDSGTYTIELEVEDQIGAIAKVSKQIKLNLPANVVINADVISGVAPFDVNFSAAGTVDPDGVFLQYEWEFPNLEYAKGEEATYRFQIPGKYSVILNATDDSGEVSQKSIEIEVLAGDIALKNYPSKYAIAGEEFSYVPAIETVDNLEYQVTIENGPSGMFIEDGVIRWTPLAGNEDQVLSFSVTSTLSVVNYEFKIVVGQKQLIAEQQLDIGGGNILLDTPEMDGISINYPDESIDSGSTLKLYKIDYSNGEAKFEMATNNTSPIPMNIYSHGGEQAYSFEFTFNSRDAVSAKSNANQAIKTGNMPIGNGLPPIQLCVSEKDNAPFEFSAYGVDNTYLTKEISGIQVYYNDTMATSLVEVDRAINSMKNKNFSKLILWHDGASNASYGSVYMDIFPDTVFLNVASKISNYTSKSVFHYVLEHENNHVMVGQINRCKGVPSSSDGNKSPYLWIVEGMAENAAGQSAGYEIVFDSLKKDYLSLIMSENKSWGDILNHVIVPYVDMSSTDENNNEYYYFPLLEYIPDFITRFMFYYSSDFDKLKSDPLFLIEEVLSKSYNKMYFLEYLFSIQNHVLDSNMNAAQSLQEISYLNSFSNSLVGRQVKDFSGKQITLKPMTGQSYNIGYDEVGANVSISVDSITSSARFLIAKCHGTSPSQYSDCRIIQTVSDGYIYYNHMPLKKDENIIITVANTSARVDAQVKFSVIPTPFTIDYSFFCVDTSSCEHEAILRSSHDLPAAASLTLAEDIHVRTSYGELIIPAGAVGSGRFSVSPTFFCENGGIMAKSEYHIVEPPLNFSSSTGVIFAGAYGDMCN